MSAGSAHFECDDCGSANIKKVGRFKASKNGKATVCGKCGNMRWKVLEVDSPDHGGGAKLRCACSQCGARPDKKTENNLGEHPIPYPNSGTNNPQEFLRKGAVIVTHRICPVCDKEDVFSGHLESCFFKDKKPYQWHLISRCDLSWPGCVRKYEDIAIVCSDCRVKVSGGTTDIPKVDRYKGGCEAQLDIYPDVIDWCIHPSERGDK